MLTREPTGDIVFVAAGVFDFVGLDALAGQRRPGDEVVGGLEREMKDRKIGGPEGAGVLPFAVTLSR